MSLRRTLRSLALLSGRRTEASTDSAMPAACTSSILRVTRPELKARLNVALEGRSFALDFNPTVDRLRVVSDSGQNLRIDVDTEAVAVDGFLKSGPARSRSSGSRFRSDVAGQRVRFAASLPLSRIPAIDVWGSRTRGSSAW